MNNFFHDTVSHIQAKRRKARRYTAMLLVLAMLTSISVSWRLHYVGTALTTDDETFCNLEEHVHTDACYEDVLVCGYEEGELIYPDEEPAAEEPEPEEPQYVKHVHTDDCYQDVEVEEEVEEQELTCGLEEHHHSDLCPIDPDTGEYLCGYEEHTHDDSCYSTVTKTVTKTERQLVCGYEEGQEVPVDPTDEPASEPAESVTPEVHHHTEACYEKKLVCTIPEHTHTAECYADWNADVEDESKWEQYAVPAQDDWNTALLTVAQGQLGYTESEKNFTVDEALGEIIGVHHYTRYGAFYNAPYGDWDVTFVSFCQHYAGIPVSVIPQRAGLMSLRSDMADMGFAYLTEGEDAPYVAIPGDIVTYYNTDGEETIGIVEDCGDDTLTVISGAVNGKVARVDVLFTDITSTIRVDDAYAEYVGEGKTEAGDHDDEISTQPGEDTTTPADGADSTFVYDYCDDGSLDLNKTPSLSEKISIDQGGHETELDPSVPIKDGTTVYVKVSYNIGPNAFRDGNYNATYTLPQGIYPTADHSGQIIKTITPEGGTPYTIVLGTYTIKKGDPKIHLNFDYNETTKDHIDNGLESTISFTTTINYDQTKGDGEIKLGDVTYKIEPNLSLSTVKKQTGDFTVVNGKVHVPYTVTVSAPYGTGSEKVSIHDMLNFAQSTVTGASYVKDSFKINGESIDDLGASIQYADDERSFTISDLPALDYQKSYTLTYEVEIDSIEGTVQSGTLKNTASSEIPAKNIKSTESSATVTLKNGVVEKLGSYDSKTHRINWTIRIKNDSVNGQPNDLAGAVLKDTMSNGALSIIGDVTVTDASGKVTATISADDFRANGYTFPENSTSASYLFTYQTEAPDSSGGAINVANTATLTEKNINYKDSSTVSVSKRDWGLTKTLAGSVPREDGNRKVLWNVTASIPSGQKEFQFLDIFTDVSGITNSHYGIQSELEEAIHQNLRLTMEGGAVWDWATAEANGIEMKILYYADRNGDVFAQPGAPARAFTIGFKRTDGTDLKVLTMSISSIPSFALSSDMELNTSRTYPNGAALKAKAAATKTDTVLKSSIANYTYTKVGSFRKTTSSTVGGSYSSIGNMDYSTSGDKLIWYKLEANLGADKHTDRPIVIEDTLPEGTEFVSNSGFVIDFDLTAQNTTMHFTNCLKTTTTPNVYTAAFGNTVYLKVDASQSGKVIFTVYPNAPASQEWINAIFKNTMDSTEHTVTIRYAVTYKNDSSWSSKDKQEQPYPNTASWEGAEDSATMTVHRAPTSNLKKTGVYDPKTQKATYTLVINPYALELNNGNDLTLTDVLTSAQPLSGMELQLDSVKLYDCIFQNDQWVPGREIDPSDYTVVPPSDTDAQKRTLKLTIPDKRAMILTYTYQLSLGDLTQAVNLSNNASLTGTSGSSVPSLPAKKEDSSVVVHNNTLTVYKTDAVRGSVITGSPATFELWSYDPDNGDNGWTQQTTKSTNPDSGTFNLTVLTKSAASDPSHIQAGVLYMLVEKTAPTNYTCDATPHYFVWAPSGTTDAAAALNSATKNDPAAAGVTGDSDFHVFGLGSNSFGSLYISNKMSVLTVRKNWLDLGGTQMDVPPVESIRFALYRYKTDGGSPTQPEDVGTYTLSTLNNWRQDITLEDGYTYFVKELDTETGELAFFEVKSSQNNDTGVTGGGTITITNKQKPSYELPSTGGSGTVPYWAAGGLLMGAAAVLLARKRRKAE